MKTKRNFIVREVKQLGLEVNCAMIGPQEIKPNYAILCKDINNYDRYIKLFSPMSKGRVADPGTVSGSHVTPTNRCIMGVNCCESL